MDSKHREFSFNLLLSSRFALLPDIYKRFSSRDVKYQHVLAQEVVFSLEDLAKEKWKSFGNGSLNRKEFQNMGLFGEKARLFLISKWKWTSCRSQESCQLSLHQSFLPGSNVWWLNEVIRSKKLTHAEPESEEGDIREGHSHLNISLLLMLKNLLIGENPSVSVNTEFSPSFAMFKERKTSWWLPSKLETAENTHT